MITYRTGNILELIGNAEEIAVVNPVNCVGVMGAGLAKAFKEAMPPHYFSEYKYACEQKYLMLGHIDRDCLYWNLNHYIINFPTKNHWKDKSNLNYIVTALYELRELCDSGKPGSAIFKVAVPKLGCGLGGLDWNDVKQVISKVFDEESPIEVIIYE